jgi:hypothetical protein
MSNKVFDKLKPYLTPMFEGQTNDESPEASMLPDGADPDVEYVTSASYYITYQGQEVSIVRLDALLVGTGGYGLYYFDELDIADVKVYKLTEIDIR